MLPNKIQGRNANVLQYWQVGMDKLKENGASDLSELLRNGCETTGQG